MYSIIHVPAAEQPAFIRSAAIALRPGGVLLIILGDDAWTGTEADWLGVTGATMYWSHENIEESRRWIIHAGLEIQVCEFVPERDRGHWLILAIKTR